MMSEVEKRRLTELAKRDAEKAAKRRGLTHKKRSEKKRGSKSKSYKKTFKF